MRITVISTLGIGGLVLAITSQSAQALIDFEAPTYTLSDVFDSQNVYPRLDGQDGWSSSPVSPAFNEERDAVVSVESLINDLGIDLSIASGGPGIEGYAVGNIGSGGAARSARAGDFIVNGNSIIADFFAHDFDPDYGLPASPTTSAVRLAGWVDVDLDNAFTNADVVPEQRIAWGLDEDNMPGQFDGPGEFAIRSAYEGTVAGGEIHSGVEYEADKWYTITFSWSEPLLDNSRNITMHVFNKTDNIEIGNVFDNYNVSETFFGPDDPSTWTGVAGRWTEGLIDNILESGDVVQLDGDLNGDGFVGLDDLDIILGAWNQNVPPADAAADPSGDGFVGLDDLDIVLNNWNAGTPPMGAVPEPATMALIGIGGAALLRRR